ncbi:MAG: hypothetical protein J6M60_01265 [Clostridia bacterium]|nr:hypothetical protein [Clostridia bacterium]
MKNNIFKYIFIIFAVVIVIFAIYMIYFRKDSNENINEIESSEEVKEVKDLRLGISNFDTLNPLLSNNKEVLNIDKIIFEPLMTIDKDYKLQKCLATECSKTSDTTYIIKIDNDKKWHNDSSLIAKDINFTIERLKEGNSIYSYNVEKISNVEILDSETIKITLTEEVPFFEYNLTFPILPSNYYVGEDFNSSTKIPIGTGMYKIDSIVDSIITLKKNENWWNIKNKNPKIETIQIKLYSEIGELYNNFKMGNTDIFTSSNSNLEQYIGTIGYVKNAYKGREFDYLAFNCEDDILSDKAVRKAINCCIDKANIVSSIFGDTKIQNDFPLDYGNYLYDPNIIKLQYSEEEAKNILQDAGWEYKYNSWQKTENYRTKRLNFTLTVEANDGERIAVAENIKEQLARLGIKISIKKVSDRQFQNTLENKNYEMILAGVYNSFSPDISSFLTGDNLQNYNNEEISKLINESKNISDENLLKEKYKKIQEIFFDEQPFIGLYRNKVYIVKNRALSGEVNGNNYFSYYNLEDWNRI